MSLVYTLFAVVAEVVIVSNLRIGETAKATVLDELEQQRFASALCALAHCTYDIKIVVI
jgi:hypothetical protein